MDANNVEAVVITESGLELDCEETNNAGGDSKDNR